MLLISSAIIALHLNLAMRAFSYPHQTPKIRPTKLVVRTVYEQKKVAAAPQKKKTMPVSSVKKKQAAPVKKKSAPVKQKTATNPKKTAQKDLLKKAAKQLETAAQKTPIKKEKTPLIVPEKKTAILTQNIQAIEEKETEYLPLLLSFFHTSLELPEIGCVTCKITLDCNGKFLNLEVLRSESVKNSTYLQNHLPQLTYPSFNGLIQGNNPEVFEITFRNAQ